MNELDDPVWGQKPNPLIARFRVEAVQMEFASAQAGRPIYEDREFVEIIVPGNRGSVAYEPVRDEHKQRWPKEYQAFKDGRELPMEGTPLASWPRVTRSRVEELAFAHIRTVEQYAAVNDAQLQHLGMGARAEREAAIKFLEVARTGTAPLERMLVKIDQLTRDNERLTRDLAAANALIERQGAEITDLKGAIHARSAA
jgi:hypothetical protein